ncbi:phosphomannomutase [Arhodomonas aquaeolei]|uniref:phosphomannomutase n=1 Tax=Arhodomonas aquaeolei TaxID=2369 RepID=UPI002166F3E2|nr:phosphomannomutase [Arhodomonas aquaeolei]MCS4505110.1 phosphomannomutase [Arhodomonas aquaeolei]
MSELLGCFKAYDIRGRVPDDLDAGLARRIGRAYAEALSPGRVALGRDIRLSSPEIAAAVADGLRDGGVDVLDIGVVGTEEVYFATFHYGLDGGIMVTASHNPRDHNGMKLVREGARPISGDSGLGDIERLAAGPELAVRPRRGTLEAFDHRPDYVEHLLGSIDTATLAPLTVVVNAGNGGAGAVVDALAPRLPFGFVRVHHEPDGHFPNGVPNPLIEASRAVTAAAVTDSGADLGVAWDGDFDRCFFFDEQGRFIEGYYIVGLLAELFLRRSPGERIIHDPRLTWNTIDLCRTFGGEAVQCKTGHAFIKERMRAEDAIYGGEMSAHHYFRDFAYCDSGMLPWLLVAELIGRTGKPLSQLVDERIARFPASGEINREIADPAAAIAAVEAEYGAEAVAVDHTDGVSIEFADWRFNLRMSNTEPVVRLNVETRGDRALMRAKTDELIARLDAFAHG